jgi:hypothetical protein
LLHSKPQQIIVAYTLFSILFQQALTNLQLNSWNHHFLCLHLYCFSSCFPFSRLSNSSISLISSISLKRLSFSPSLTYATTGVRGKKPASAFLFLLYIRFCGQQVSIQEIQRLLPRTYASTSRLPTKLRNGSCGNTISETCFSKHCYWLIAVVHNERKASKKVFVAFFWSHSQLPTDLAIIALNN